MTQDDTTLSAQPTTRRAQAKAERRQALIEATITSIAEHGLSGTTIARVTEIAGTSMGLASFYFETKERLLEAVLQHLADQERALWVERTIDPEQTPAERLVAMVDARFDRRVFNDRHLAVWFAFWGDAGARQIYRRIVESSDEARLWVEVELIEAMRAGTGHAQRRAMQTALGIEAFYDGLRLNHLLYPEDFKRSVCRDCAIEQLISLFPDHFEGLQPVAGRAADRMADAEDLIHGT
jgi:TetR/AcrR family transcriptional repressor of bet genes